MYIKTNLIQYAFKSARRRRRLCLVYERVYCAHTCGIHAYKRNAVRASMALWVFFLFICIQQFSLALCAEESIRYTISFSFRNPLTKSKSFALWTLSLLNRSLIWHNLTAFFISKCVINQNIEINLKTVFSYYHRGIVRLCRLVVIYILQEL